MCNASGTLKPSQRVHMKKYSHDKEVIYIEILIEISDNVDKFYIFYQNQVNLFEIHMNSWLKKNIFLPLSHEIYLSVACISAVLMTPVLMTQY